MPCRAARSTSTCCPERTHSTAADGAELVPRLHEEEGVDVAGIEQVHRVDDERRVRGVPAGHVGDCCIGWMASTGSCFFHPLRAWLDQSPYPRLTPRVPLPAASASTAPPSCQLMLSQSISTATRIASVMVLPWPGVEVSPARFGRLACRHPTGLRNRGRGTQVARSYPMTTQRYPHRIDRFRPRGREPAYGPTGRRRSRAASPWSIVPF